MLNDPRFTAEVELTIPFYDVDMMGMTWHGNYFRYFEVAREALLNQLSYDYRQMKRSGYLRPVVDAWVRYRHALTFEQRIRIRTRIEGFRNHLRIGCQVFDAETGKCATTGYITQVTIEERSRELCFVSPNILFKRIEVKP